MNLSLKHRDSKILPNTRKKMGSKNQALNYRHVVTTLSIFYDGAFLRKKVTSFGGELEQKAPT